MPVRPEGIQSSQATEVNEPCMCMESDLLYNDDVVATIALPHAIADKKLQIALVLCVTLGVDVDDQCVCMMAVRKQFIQFLIQPSHAHMVAEGPEEGGRKHVSDPSYVSLDSHEHMMALHDVNVQHDEVDPTGKPAGDKDTICCIELKACHHLVGKIKVKDTITPRMRMVQSSMFLTQEVPRSGRLYRLELVEVERRRCCLGGHRVFCSAWLSMWTSADLNSNKERLIGAL